MSLLIATPCYGNQVWAPYLESVLALQEQMLSVGFPFEFLFTKNDSLITRARNTSAATFITRTECERLLFIDADIEFDADSVGRLWLMDKPVAVAAYRMKREDEPLCAWKDGELVELGESDTEPMTVDYAGTGFMMIKREVFTEMAQMNPWIHHQEGHVGDCWAFFDTGVDGGVYLSEDYWFCQRWRDMGGEIWLDPTIRLGHWGNKRYG